MTTQKTFNVQDSSTTTHRKVPSYCTCRWMLALIGFFGMINVYAMRVNLSVAMVCMINHTAVHQNLYTQQGSYNLSTTNFSLVPGLDVDSCGGVESANKTVKDGEFEWSKATQGLILSSFFWGYLVMQIPGGWLAQRFGGKRIIGYFMALTVASTILSSVGARASPYLLIVLRILNGMGQGVVFPALHVLFSKWAPPLERSRLIGFTFAGAQIGNVLTFPISGVLCDSGFDGGWSSIFYVIGICGGVWLIFWFVLISDSPAQHPRISYEEREMIVSSLGAQKSKAPGVTPWLQFAKSPPVYAIVAAHCCSNWGTYTLLTNIPTYMKEVLKFDIQSNGLFSAIPYIVFWAFINIGGVIADYMRSKGIPTKVVRKIMVSIGTLIPAVFLIATGYVTCHAPYGAVVVLSLAVGFSGFQYPGFMVNHADIAPPFAGVLFGISNTMGTLSGVIAPYVVGVLTTNSTQGEWRVVFYISAVIYLIGAILFCLLGDGEIQPWVRPYMTQDLPRMQEEEADIELVTPVRRDTEDDQAPREKNGLHKL